MEEMKAVRRMKESFLVNEDAGGQKRERHEDDEFEMDLGH